ncbi:alpha/beta fold hydrolase [uncultured Hymenobacter sp.]|uniref:alpha/beta fold hydrolase n=1 Tax=uncultured Hymenobacter sp. TaxID=170016 RepID=UPI0035CB76EB
MKFTRLLPVLATGLLIQQVGLAQPTTPFGGMPAGGAPRGGIAKARNLSIKRKFMDVAYAAVSPAQQLDIYLPDAGNGPFPVIVYLHGGAFKMGDKGDDQVNPALEGLRRGYAVVSVNYRLSGEATFPAPLEDIKAAIRFVRANAKQYQLNPNKVAAWGNSSGANMASLVGTTGDTKTFDNPKLGHAGQSSAVQAVVDWYGPIQFDQMDAQLKASGKGRPDHDEALSPESVVIGQPIQQAPELVRRASPAAYLSKNDPPFFIEHGTDDPIVPTQQSQNFHADLVKVLGKDHVTLTLLEGAGHGGPQFETPENLGKVFAFLDKYLK